MEIEPARWQMHEHGASQEEGGHGRSDEDQADQRSHRENLRFLQRGPLVDIYSQPGNLNRHLEHIPPAAVADDADLISTVRAGWVQETSLNLAEKNRVSAVSQQQRDDRPAIAVIGGQRFIAKGASFRVKGFFCGT